MLVSATEHYQRQQRITALGVIAARKNRSKGLAAVVRTVTAYQLIAARDGADSVPLMLAEQGLTSDPAGTVAVTALAGYASDGRALEGLFSQADTDQMFDLMVATQLQDMARFGSGFATLSNYGATGYVRMLNPPSCARCAILAGSFYKTEKPFQRHPRCDCRHVPTNQTLAGDLLTDPKAAFEAGLIKRDYTYTTVDGVERSRMVDDLTRDQIKALQDGADISQVVNIYRSQGITETGFGGTVRRSTEGTTKRGLAYKGRTGRNATTRLTPYSIYRLAENREDAIRLLKLNGYLL